MRHILAMNDRQQTIHLRCDDDVTSCELVRESRTYLLISSYLHHICYIGRERQLGYARLLVFAQWFTDGDVNVGENFRVSF